MGFYLGLDNEENPNVWIFFARHFTDFSIQYAKGNQSAEIDSELKTLINMMNAMYFINLDHSDCAPYWWLRNGTADNHTSQTVMIIGVTPIYAPIPFDSYSGPGFQAYHLQLNKI